MNNIYRFTNVNWNDKRQIRIKKGGSTGSEKQLQDLSIPICRLQSNLVVPPDIVYKCYQCSDTFVKNNHQTNSESLHRSSNQSKQMCQMGQGCHPREETDQRLFFYAFPVCEVLQKIPQSLVGKELNGWGNWGRSVCELCFKIKCSFS